MCGPFEAFWKKQWLQFLASVFSIFPFEVIISYKLCALSIFSLIFELFSSNNFLGDLIVFNSKLDLCTGIRGLHSQMPFPGNQIFPKKIWEISRPEHLGTSSSRSQLSTGIQDWLLPGLISGREKHSEFPNASRMKINNFNFGARQDLSDCYQFLIKFSSRQYFPNESRFLI